MFWSDHIGILLISLNYRNNSIEKINVIIIIISIIIMLIILIIIISLLLFLVDAILLNCRHYFINSEFGK